MLFRRLLGKVYTDFGVCFRKSVLVRGTALLRQSTSGSNDYSFQYKSGNFFGFLLALDGLLKKGKDMGNKENKSRAVRIVLGMIVVLSLLAVGGLWAFYGAGDSIGNGVRIYGALANHLLAPIKLPSVVFYLLVLGAVAACILIGRSLYKKFFSKDEVWRHYRGGTFFWVDWQWDYTWNGKISNLWCDCEKCADRMKPKIVPDGTGDLGIRYICNGCGKQSTTIRSVESQVEARDRVKKKILRKIRVGKYRGAIEGH